MYELKNQTYYQISRDRVKSKLEFIISQEEDIKLVREKISDVTESYKTYIVCSILSFLATIAFIGLKDIFLALAASCMLCGIGGGICFGGIKMIGWIVGDKILRPIQYKLLDKKDTFQKQLTEANKKLLSFNKEDNIPQISTSSVNPTSSFLSSLFNIHKG